MDRIGTVVRNIPRTNVTTWDQRKYLMSSLGPMNIKITFNPNNGITFLTVFKRNGPFGSSTRPYIGWVIDLAGGEDVCKNDGALPVMDHAPFPRVLCVVPTPVVNQYVYEDVISAEKAYVVPIADGTSVTMYWYQGRWRYSTIGCYEFGPMIWRDGVTHGDVIGETFEKCGFDISTLDPRKCYTVGFKGRPHPFLEGGGEIIHRVWLIRTVDVEGVNRCIESPPDVTPRFEDFVSTVDGDICIPPQVPVNIPLGDIPDHLSSSYDRFLKTKVVNYGYILKTPEGGSYLMESVLFTYVKSIFYDAPVPGSRKDRRSGGGRVVSAPPVDRHRFCVLHAVLSGRYSLVFSSLFPQYEDEVKGIKRELLVIHGVLVSAHRGYVVWHKKNPRARRSAVAAWGANVEEKYRPLWGVMALSTPVFYSQEFVPSMISEFIASGDNAKHIYPIIYPE